MKKITNRYTPITQNEIQTIARQIAQKFNPLKIVLFGSYAWGTPHPFSDVDLLVIIDKKFTKSDPEIEIALSVHHNFPMDILVRTPHQVAERLQLGDKFLQNMIEEGIVLYERSGA